MILGYLDTQIQMFEIYPHAQRYRQQVIDDLGVGSYQVLVVMFCSGLMLADGAMMLTLDSF